MQISFARSLAIEILAFLFWQDAKMTDYPLHQMADEARKRCIVGFPKVKPSRKEIESSETTIQSLKFLNDNPPPTSVDKLHMCNSEIELDDARVKLKQAEISKRMSEIGAEWDAQMRSHRNAMENVEKVRGEDLINIEAIDRNPVVNLVNDLKKQFQGTNGCENYDEEPHTFRIPSVLSRVCFVTFNAHFVCQISFAQYFSSYLHSIRKDDVRPYLDRVPLDGFFTVKTPDLKTHGFISSLVSRNLSIFIVNCLNGQTN